MNPEHLLECAIRPALDHMGMGGKAAEELILGTAIVESGLKYLKQLGNGPALGLWQMEPATHQDIYDNWLVYRDDAGELLSNLVVERAETFAPSERLDQLTWNLRYAAAMCRLKYYRSKTALPEAGDLEGQARFWKSCYNSHLGKGTVGKYVKRWRNVMS